MLGNPSPVGLRGRRPRALARQSLHHPYAGEGSGSNAFFFGFGSQLVQGLGVQADREWLRQILGHAYPYRFELIPVVSQIMGIPELGFFLDALELRDRGLLFRLRHRPHLLSVRDRALAPYG